MVFDPVEGLHYPGSTGDFLAWFRSDVDCLDYLSWLRWPNGFVCPPVRYRDLVLSEGTTRIVPKPRRPGSHPTSVERLTANRPWRQPL